MANKEIPTLSSPADKLKLNGAVSEITQAFQRIADQKSFIKDVQERMEEELGFPKADLLKLANERYKDAQSNILERAQEIVDLNEELVEIGRKAAQGKLVVGDATTSQTGLFSATKQTSDEEE